MKSCNKKSLECQTKEFSYFWVFVSVIYFHDCKDLKRRKRYWRKKIGNISFHVFFVCRLLQHERVSKYAELEYEAHKLELESEKKIQTFTNEEQSFRFVVERIKKNLSTINTKAFDRFELCIVSHEMRWCDCECITSRISGNKCPTQHKVHLFSLLFV